ncbi:MAG: hypothetical protein ACXABI_13805 [Candidatus Hodarchaeales archaeon]
MDNNINFFDDQGSNRLFSIIFAIGLLYFLQEFALVLFFQNLVYLPFNLIHEFGHFCMAILFVPFIDPRYEIRLINDCRCSNLIKIEQLPANWISIFIMFSGTILILSLALICLVKLRNTDKPIWEVFKRFMIFGIVYDLTNLFPILPSVLGTTNDGYAISVILLRMEIFILPTIYSSIFFSCLAFFFVLISYYYLGSSIYHLFTLPKAKMHKDVPYPLVS